MESDDPRDEIARLEDHIESLARTLERCRKIALTAKIAIAVGAIVMLALIAGAIRFNPAAMVGAMAAMIGGIVMFGSNNSTANQASADMQASEAQRAELIGRIDLRVVDLSGSGAPAKSS